MGRSRRSRIFTNNPMYRGILLGAVLGVLLFLAGKWVFSPVPSAEIATRNAIASAEQQELLTAVSCFERIGYPNADLAGDILPTLEKHLHAASTLDAVLCGTCGTQYSLLDGEVLRYVTLTMAELHTAVKQGTSTDAGIENLSVYMLMLKNSLGERFDAKGAVLALPTK